MVSDPHMRRLDVQPTPQMARHPAPQKYINLLLAERSPRRGEPAAEPEFKGRTFCGRVMTTLDAGLLQSTTPQDSFRREVNIRPCTSRQIYFVT
jgi:hypothetical protein